MTPEEHERELERLRASATPSPVICHINCILVDMCRTNTHTRTFKQSEPLPELPPWPDGDPIGGADFTHAVNRLKIMSGLNPVTYQDAVDGKFSLKALGKDWQAQTHFEDTADDPWFSLAIEEEKKEDD